MQTFTSNRAGLFFIVALTLLAAMMTSTAQAQTEQEVEREEADAAAAYAEFVALQEEVDDAVAAHEAIRAQTFDLEYHMDRLAERVANDMERAAELREQAEEMALSAYMGGNRRNVNAALEAATIQDVVTSQALFERANQTSLASLDRLKAVTREVERLSDDLAMDRIRMRTLEEEAVVAVEVIQVVQAAALEWYEREDAEALAARETWEKELERRRVVEAKRRAREIARKAAAEARAAEEAKRKAKKEAARRAEAERKAAQDQNEDPQKKNNYVMPEGADNDGVYEYLTCPQTNPKWFRDTWGAPRSGRRTHKGTDIYSPKGTNVYAVVDGRIRTRTGGLGGRALWLYGEDGNAYYYAHLDAWASDVTTGTRVRAGDLIAFVGNTGNASGGANHTHFQLHPGGGAPINPYPTLVAIC